MRPELVYFSVILCWRATLAFLFLSIALAVCISFLDRLDYPFLYPPVPTRHAPFLKWEALIRLLFFFYLSSSPSFYGYFHHIPKMFNRHLL